MTVFGPNPEQKDFGFDFAASTDVTDIASKQNNTGQDLLILDRGIYVETGDAGVTVDMGFADDADTNGDTLIDGQSIATDGSFVTAAGSNGATLAVWEAGKFINLKKAGGTISGINGHVWLTCVPASSPKS